MKNDSKITVYLISGLGADKRVFEYLDLGDYDTRCIDWLVPIENETIAKYAKRLVAQISDGRIVLIGVSFGGVIALEISKLIAVEKVIQISSIRGTNDIPVGSRWAGFFKLHKIMPASLFTTVNDGVFWFFGVEKEKDKKVLRKIIEESDPEFIKWGIDQMMCWKHRTKPGESIVIHGTEDRIFPNTKGDYNIEGGGHLMVINKSDEISRIIKEILKG